MVKDFHGLRVDKTWATQAVYNLIANALKFSRAGEAPAVEIWPYRSKGTGSKVVGIAVRYAVPEWHRSTRSGYFTFSSGP